jgi:hypothetical protein
MLHSPGHKVISDISGEHQTGPKDSTRKIEEIPHEGHPEDYFGKIAVEDEWQRMYNMTILRGGDCTMAGRKGKCS